MIAIDRDQIANTCRREEIARNLAVRAWPATRNCPRSEVTSWVGPANHQITKATWWASRKTRPGCIERSLTARATRKRASVLRSEPCRLDANVAGALRGCTRRTVPSTRPTSSSCQIRGSQRTSKIARALASLSTSRKSDDAASIAIGCESTARERRGTTNPPQRPSRFATHALSCSRCHGRGGYLLPRRPRTSQKKGGEHHTARSPLGKPQLSGGPRRLSGGRA